MLVPAAIDEAAPPPMPMRMPGPPSWTSSGAGAEGQLAVWPSLIVPRPAIMIGIVVAAAHASHRLLEDAEVASRWGGQLVVERRRRPAGLGHDLQGTRDVLGLADGIVLPRLLVPGRFRLETWSR